MARRRKNREAMASADANPPQHIPHGVKVDHATMLPGFRPLKTGWTPERLQRFFDVLRYTGCVLDSCQVAGISDTSAYKMKARFPLFSAAWDDALARSQKGLIAIAHQRAVEGRETIIIRKGEEFQRKIEPSDSMLGLLIKRGDMSGGRLGEKAEDVLTFEEYKAGWRFAGFGKKYKLEDPAKVKARLNAKFDLMRKRMFADADRQGVCARCNAPLPSGVTNAMLDGG